MIAGTMPRWVQNVYTFSFVAMVLLFATLGWFSLRSLSWAQNAQSRKGVIFVSGLFMVLALSGIVMLWWFWRRLVREFKFDGRALYFETLGIRETQTRRISEIVQVGEWQGRGGPQGYRIEFRDGARLYLHNSVSNAIAAAERIGNDLGFFSPDRSAPKPTRRGYVSIMFFVAIGAGWAAFNAVRHLEQALPTEISREEFLSEVVQGRVARVVVTDRILIRGTSSTRGAFRVRTPVDDAMVKKLRSQGVIMTFERSSDLIP